MFRILKHRLMESTPGTEGSTSPTTTQPTSSDPSSTEGGDTPSFDFADLATHDDNDPSPPVSEGGVAPAAPVTTAPAAPPGPSAQAAPPAQTPQTAPVAAPPSPQAAPAVPGQPAPAQEPVAPQAVPSSQPQQTAPLTQEQIAKSFAEHRAQFQPQLEKLYQIEGNWDEATIEQLRTNPEKTLPKLAAQLHYEVQLSTYNSVMQALPEVFSQMFQRREEVNRYETTYKNMYPQLFEKKEYEQTSESSIRAVRAANPNMDMDEVLKRAGIMACITLGLPLPGMQQQQAPAPQNLAPQVRQPPPGRPAGVNSTPPLPAPGADDSGNIFADLVNESIAGRI